MYVTDRTNGTVTRCTADVTTGAVGNCGTPVTSFTTPTSVTVSGNYAYVANFGGNTVTQCTLDANGDLTSCVDSGATGLTSPTDVVVVGSNAYVVNFGNSSAVPSVPSSISKCTVDATTGALSACADAGATQLNNPIGIAIQGSVAYITNNGDASVSQCAIDGTTGNLTCSTGTKYLGLGLSSPYGIAVNGTSLYIVSQGTSSDPTSSKVTRCSLDATTGNVDTASCTTEAGFTLAGATGWYQTNRIAFHGGYAYLTNRNLNGVAQCSVDATTGALSACAAAAPMLNAATGITIK